MTKMKFGLQVGNHAVSWHELSHFVRFLDRETRFHSAWTYDHFVVDPETGPASVSCMEGWTLLAALAPITDRVRLGCLVTGVTHREPGVLAKMAATVDHISDGRLEFGIGAAWNDVEHKMLGIRFPPVAERMDRLEEAVQLIRLLFESEGPVSFEGEHYRLDEAHFAPKSVQRPWPPIMVGGEGERRTLRIVARYADAMNLGGTPAMVARKIAVLERHCREAGRDPAEIRKTITVPVVVSENERLIDRIAGMLVEGWGLSAEEAKAQSAIGSAAHVRDVIKEYAGVGVTEIIANAPGPWKLDIYRRLNDEVVTAFA
jgi:F420-dependent oxidoreductase-like protein